MAGIGIGVVTYNRLDYLKRVIAGVRAHTKSEHTLVVAEDGGEDGSREWCAREGIQVVSGRNGGVCWNKNRALFALEAAGCDPILLVEDDCLPVRDGWETEWRIATALFGHLAYAHPKIVPWQISGSGTATDPIVNNKATAQCSSVSGIALREVGFFDTRFKGYGVGHAEWTTRIKRAGYGFKRAVDATGREVKANLYIEGGLIGDDAPTFKDRQNVARNEALFDSLKKEPIYRHPWSDEEERERFLSEIVAAGIDPGYYDRAMQEAGGPVPELAVRHRPAYARALKAVLGGQDGAERLSALATSLPIHAGELVPGLTVPLLELLRERAGAEWRVLDLASGYSPLWWARRVASVVAAVPDVSAIEVLRRIGLAAAATLIPTPNDAACAEAIRSIPDPFDVVSLDGHGGPASVQAALPQLKPEGILLLAESRDKKRAAVRQLLLEQGFLELAFHGPSARPGAAAVSSAFYRRGANCLGL